MDINRTVIYTTTAIVKLIKTCSVQSNMYKGYADMDHKTTRVWVCMCSRVFLH